MSVREFADVLSIGWGIAKWGSPELLIFFSPGCSFRRETSEERVGN